MKPKKSLGQNFLKSEGALRSIVEAGDIHATDVILEIGPGKGALTEKLLATGAHIVAIEKDRELIPILAEKFKNEITGGQLKLIEADILEFDFKQYEIPSRYKLIANIPYYITGAIIRKFLSGEHQPEKMVLLVQKEVADRIVARGKKESLLSLSVKIYGTPRYVAKVSKRYFTPVPKVDSAIIEISAISKKNLEDISEKAFFDLLHAGFAHKRKVLIKNIECFAKEREKNIDLGALFDNLDISRKARAEDVSLPVWIALAKSFR